MRAGQRVPRKLRKLLSAKNKAYWQRRRSKKSVDRSKAK